MRLRSAFIVILLLVFAASMAPMAAGHGAGSGVVSARGSFLLDIPGTQNDTVHTFLSDFGLPIGPGDRLAFSWKANNGSGPPVYFEIHAHPAAVGYIVLYNTTARSDSGTWTVPGSDPYMVYWQNPNQGVANVSYAFDLFPPPPDLWPLVLMPITLAVIALAWLVARRRGRRTPPS